MANMNAKKSPKPRKQTSREIDDLVISQAENDAAWESPVEVRRGKPGSFSIPPDLGERAAFLARMHHAPGVGEWLTRVIKERIEIEEVAYAAAKRELKSKRERRPPA
jgi:hypothetical protein